MTINTDLICSICTNKRSNKRPLSASEYISAGTSRQSFAAHKSATVFEKWRCPKTCSRNPNARFKGPRKNALRTFANRPSHKVTQPLTIQENKLTAAARYFLRCISMITAAAGLHNLGSFVPSWRCQNSSTINFGSRAFFPAMTVVRSTLASLKAMHQDVNYSLPLKSENQPFSDRGIRLT